MTPGEEKLRIAFIGARGVGGTYSGIETYYEEVGSRLAARGHEVTAYCRTYFTPDTELYRGIRVRRLPSLRSKHLETLSHSVLATFDALFRGYDIVQFHALGSAPLSVLPRIFGKKTVVSVRGLDWQRAKWGKIARWVLQAGEWASVRLPTSTVVVSETLRDHYRTHHDSETRVIRNAVIPADRRPPRRIASLGLERDQFLLFVGRISPEKGIHTLLEALNPLPRSKKLVLAGGSSYSDSYIRSVKEMAWNEVVFLGKVDHETIEELLSNCYAFVLPSTIEGLSIALLEALSFGTCIVTTAIPENLEVVAEAGIVFPPEDVEALRERLRAILDSPELVRQHRELTAKRAEDWPDWDGVTDQTEEFYRILVTSHPSMATSKD
ncbi:MAG: glycosyltransferase family 4 protein [Thermoanaerobaculia bacterium]